MPKDVQEAVFTPDFDMEMDIPGYNPVLPVPADKLLHGLTVGFTGKGVCGTIFSRYEETRGFA